MKKFIPFLSIAVAMAACNTTPESGTSTASPIMEVEPVNTDTTGLAEFQQWKAQNELTAENKYNQTASYAAAAAPARQKAYKAPVRRTAAVASTYERPSSSDNTSSGTRNSETREGTAEGNEGTAQGTGPSEAPASTEAEKPAAKTGVSKAAKGAVIGGVGGAAAGAVINKKNRGAGAVIGGVVGAAGGYVLGRKMDKKDGRY